MGSGIDQEIFNEVDYARFGQRLTQCLATLGQLLARGLALGSALPPWGPSWNCSWLTMRPGRCR